MTSRGSSLPPDDLKRLRTLLELGHRLESLWSDRWPSAGAPSTEALEAFEAFRNHVAELSAQAANEDLRRLHIHSRQLSLDMTARHLATLLVPFERLSGRSLRDDEFLIDTEDLTDRERQVAPLVVIADHIRSAFNVGAILRTSEAFGLERVILTGYTPTPDEEKTSRTSMGSQTQIAWESIAKTEEAIDRLKADGYSIVALETERSATDLVDFQWPEKSALVLGNERFGLGPEILAKADHVVRIPLHGRKNSLNVGIALGVAAADYRKKLAEPTLSPIGVFRSPATHPYEAPRQGVKNESEKLGWIELNPRRQFEQALQGLEGFERIWIIYDFHHNRHWKPMVLPPRGPRVKRGVFATRSPYRPNPLGLSCVELVRIEGLRVFVRGFDLLDGTPVYDLKPYLPYADAFPNSRAGWTESLEEEKYRVHFAPKCEAQLEWLESHGVDQLQGFLLAQLEHGPMDNERKRLELGSDEGGPHLICYRTWRAVFRIDASAREVLVERVDSGYSDSDLSDPADRYQDKDLHKKFCAEFSPS